MAKIDAKQPERIEKVKALILEDMKAGLIPPTVRSFSELHDHVDANEYLLEVWPDWDPADDCVAENALMDAITAWLAQGELARC